MNKNILTLLPSRKPQKALGHVSLVGAGPGDPELITLKAVRLLKEADAIVYDRLANPEFLEYAKIGCETIYVGKKKDQHSLPQKQIAALLVALAQQGKNVVRLKGGDPFIFGRGGEEIDVLNQHHVPCSVVPGITAAIGCAAATKIPLTHRDHAHAVTFITGHRKDDKLTINWDLALQRDSSTVFYMGLSNLGEITQQLLDRGCSSDKPMAIIAEGTSNKQQVLISDVSHIAEKLKGHPMPSPALIVLGDVVHANDYAKELSTEFEMVKAEAILS